MLGRKSFKIELMQISPKTLRPTEVLRAQEILTSNTNHLLTPEVSFVFIILLSLEHLIAQRSCSTFIDLGS